MSHQFDRRRLFGAAFATVAATHFGVTRADAQPLNRAGATAFPAYKQAHAGVLDIGYAEAGAMDAPIIVLLHGWPYDIHSFVDVAPSWFRRGIG